MTAVLTVETNGQGFVEITTEAARFIAAGECSGRVLLMFLRHTSASLVIQENADPDVRTDLAAALDRLAPADAGWVHVIEGPDDMPSHVKTMLTGVSLHVPVRTASRCSAIGRASSGRASRHAAPPRGRAAVHRSRRESGREP